MTQTRVYPNTAIGRKVSVFAGLYNARAKGNPVTTEEWLGRIRGGHYSEFVNKVRAARGSPDYDKLRKHLDAVTYGGVFLVGRTKDDTPTPSSGLVFLDWDQKGEVPDLALRDATKERLSQQPGVLAVYESVGGFGLHVIAVVDPEPRTHAEYGHVWTLLTNALDLSPGGDETVKHITRLALASYDPDLRINPDTVPYAWNVADAPSEATTKARARADLRSRQFFHYKPLTAAEWLCLVGAHYGANTVNAEVPDFTIACPCHGGTNETSLHLWMVYRRLGEDRKWEDVKGPPQDDDKAILLAHCFSCKSPQKTILRFLEWETRVQTPLDADLWIPELVAIPGVDSKGKQKYKVDPRIALSDQIIDVLDALRLDIRSPEPEGGLEVRTFVEGDDKYPLPRLLRETVPNAKPGEWIYLTPSLYAHLRGYVDRAVGADTTDSKYNRTVTTLAPPVNVRVEWLETLPKWDGQVRLRTLFKDALGAATEDVQGNTNLAGVAGEAFMVGLVARAYDPGCVHDWMPVLIGAQGLGKSRFCKDLFPRALQARWHEDGVAVDQDTQRLAESAGPCWVAEFSEMRGVRSLKAVEHFKNVMSQQKDRFRRPYAVAPDDHLRGWAGIGTANGDEAIPDDPTGSRRYVAIECGETADWDYVPKNREQLWAEAIIIYQTQAEDAHPRNLIPPEWRALQETQNDAFRVKTDTVSEELAESLHQRRANHIGLDKAAPLVALWGVAQQMAAISNNPGNLMPNGGDAVRNPNQKQVSVFGARLSQLGWSKQRKVWPDGVEQVRWWVENSR